MRRGFAIALAMFGLGLASWAALSRSPSTLVSADPVGQGTPARDEVRWPAHTQLTAAGERVRAERAAFEALRAILDQAGRPGDAKHARESALAAIEALPPAKRRLESSQRLEQSLRRALAPQG